MKTRTVADIQSLDEELNLFEETDWDFMSVVDSQEENFEFFDDVLDIDYNEKKAKIRNFAPFVAIGILIVAEGVWLGTTFLNKQDVAYENFQASLAQEQQIQYVDGVEVTSEELISINQLLASYFNTMQNKGDYANLNALCFTDSSFAIDYESSMDKMKSSWDAYDCNARAISEFGSYLQLNKIDKVIENEDTYYAYCDVTVPSKEDVYEYIHLYSYNLTKYFMSNEVNQQNIAKFLLDTMETNPVPTTSEIICIELVKTENGQFKIFTDSEILSICDTAYSYSVSQIAKILGNNMSDESM